jgi:hypothetical protein
VEIRVGVARVFEVKRSASSKCGVG